MNNNPIKHHWVPASYQFPFASRPNLSQARESFIWVLDVDSKKNREDKLENVFIKKNLYTIDIDGQKSYHIEESLAGIEGSYAELFSTTIAKLEPLSEEQRVMLAVFTAAMLLRTRKFESVLQRFYGELTGMSKQIAMSKGIKSKTVDQLEDLQKGILPKNLEYSLEPIANVLYKMSIVFLIASSKSYYISSDNPCFFYDPSAYKLPLFYQGVGLSNINTEVFMPLSPKISLLLTWHNVSGYLSIDNATVNEQNRMIVGHAAKQIISHSNKIKYIWFSKCPLQPRRILSIYFYRLKHIFLKHWINLKLKVKNNRRGR